MMEQFRCDTASATGYRFIIVLVFLGLTQLALNLTNVNLEAVT